MNDRPPAPRRSHQDRRCWRLMDPALPALRRRRDAFPHVRPAHPLLQGLTEGKLRGTNCVNPKCPITKGEGELWIPPRADCPDCHQPMVWEA